MGIKADIPTQPKKSRKGQGNPLRVRKVALRKQIAVITHYAATGNAKLAGEQNGVPATNARRIVRAAIEGTDPVLAEALGSSGAALRSYVLDAAERALLVVIEVSIDRLINTGSWIQGNSLQNDPGPAYAKAIVDAHKSLVAGMRVHAELEGAVGPANGLSVQFIYSEDSKDESPVMVEAIPSPLLPHGEHPSHG